MPIPSFEDNRVRMYIFSGEDSGWGGTIQRYRILYLTIIISLAVHGSLLMTLPISLQSGIPESMSSSVFVKLVSTESAVKPQPVRETQPMHTQPQQRKVTPQVPKDPLNHAKITSPVPKVLTATPHHSKHTTHVQDIVSKPPEQSKLIAQATKQVQTSPPASASATTEPSQAAPQATDDAVRQPEPSPPRYDVAYLHNPPPSYPGLARRLHLQGTVILKVHIDAQGSPREVLVEHSTGHNILDQAAVRAVHDWRFLPARQAMTAVEAWVRVPVAFTLHDQ